jgi:hypothetical protein
MSNEFCLPCENDTGACVGNGCQCECLGAQAHRGYAQEEEMRTRVEESKANEPKHCGNFGCDECYGTSHAPCESLEQRKRKKFKLSDILGPVASKEVLAQRLASMKKFEKMVTRPNDKPLTLDTEEGSRLDIIADELWASLCDPESGSDKKKILIKALADAEQRGAKK